MRAALSFCLPFRSCVSVVVHPLLPSTRKDYIYNLRVIFQILSTKGSEILEIYTCVKALYSKYKYLIRQCLSDAINFDKEDNPLKVLVWLVDIMLAFLNSFFKKLLLNGFHNWLLFRDKSWLGYYESEKAKCENFDLSLWQGKFGNLIHRLRRGVDFKF